MNIEELAVLLWMWEDRASTVVEWQDAPSESRMENARRNFARISERRRAPWLEAARQWEPMFRAALTPENAP